MSRIPHATSEAGIEAIISIEPDAIAAFTPSLSDYKNPSAGWVETEYRCLAEKSEKVVAGFWTGEPGHVSFDEWPYTEICSILTGRVAVRDRSGRQREFGPGTAFIIPKGWPGDWLTLQASTKIFVAVS